jgi:hypothetical protein
MHDPMTVAFDIGIPRFWRRKKPYRGSIDLITIWHVDPEKDGSDDSCDWWGRKKTRENGWSPVMLDEYHQLSDEAKEAVHFLWWAFRGKLSSRPWWRHPRWHIHHWQIQVHFILVLKRWLFSRCCECGGRFTWREAAGQVVSDQWNGPGPGWFKNAEKVRHFRCSKPAPMAFVPHEAPHTDVMN